MGEIDGMLLALQIINFCVLILIVLFRKYFFAYFSEKGKNLATKEDVAEITNEIEAVRVEYSKGVEKFKSDLWKHQREYEWYREDVKIKVSLLQDATHILSSFDDAVLKNIVCTSSRDIALSISKLPIDDSSRAFFLNEYSAYRVKSEESYLELRSLSADISRHSVLLRAYFSDELADLFVIIANMGNSTASVSVDNLDSVIAKEFSLNSNVDEIKRGVVDLFDSRWSEKRPLDEMRKFHENVLVIIKDLTSFRSPGNI